MLLITCKYLLSLLQKKEVLKERVVIFLKVAKAASETESGLIRALSNEVVQRSFDL